MRFTSFLHRRHARSLKGHFRRPAHARVVSAVGKRSPRAGTVDRVDWSLFHAINAGVAIREWLEDPITLLSGGAAVALYGAAIVALWFLARPYRDPKWKLACASGLTAAAVAMLTNQAISHVWERPRPFVTHPAFTHLLTARLFPDPSFPSDHTAAIGLRHRIRRSRVLPPSRSRLSCGCDSHQPLPNRAAGCAIRATCSPVRSWAGPRRYSLPPWADPGSRNSSRSSAGSPTRFSSTCGLAFRDGRSRRDGSRSLVKGHFRSLAHTSESPPGAVLTRISEVRDTLASSVGDLKGA